MDSKKLLNQYLDHADLYQWHVIRKFIVDNYEHFSFREKTVPTDGSPAAKTEKLVYFHTKILKVIRHKNGEFTLKICIGERQTFFIRIFNRYPDRKIWRTQSEKNESGQICYTLALKGNEKGEITERTGWIEFKGSRRRKFLIERAITHPATDKVYKIGRKYYKRLLNGLEEEF